MIFVFWRVPTVVTAVGVWGAVLAVRRCRPGSVREVVRI